MINMTDSAVAAVSRFINSNPHPIAGLRIKVEGGGCSGFKYSMKLEQSADADDCRVECGGLVLLIDQTSATLLGGVTVDFVDGMDGSGFTFSNPNATSSCGCGKSFAC
jgi:iron-sulfur cluster assembly protein